MKLKNFFLSIVFFHICISFAQFPNWSWAKSAGNGINDYGNSIVVTKSNVIYVLGQFNNSSIIFGTNELKNAGKETNDLFIAKYDVLGNLIWTKSFGGEGDDFGISMVADKDENVFITGGFTSSKIGFGMDSLINAGQLGTNDGFIAKLNLNGEVRWAYAIGGQHDDKTNSIAIDNYDNVYVTGSFLSKKLTFNKGDTLENKGDGSGSFSDVFAAKYTNDGKLIWAKGINGSSNELGCGITCDSKNNVYITGGTFSSELKFDTISIKSSAFDSEIKKEQEHKKQVTAWLDSNGNIHPDSIKGGRRIVYTPGGPSVHHKEKIFIAKYSDAGVLQWAEIVGGSDDEETSAITTDKENNIFVTGRFQSSSMTMETSTMTNEGSNDIFIAKYGSDGHVFWAKSVGGIADDRGNNIKMDAAGNAYITGWFASPKVYFDKIILTNSGGKGFTDLFIAKYDTNGNALWAENAKGIESEWANAVDIDKDGNMYLTGGFDSPDIKFGNIFLINGKAKDFFIAKINAK